MNCFFFLIVCVKKVTTLLLVPGDEAAIRARLVGEAIIARAEQALRDRRLPALLESRIDLLGNEECNSTVTL